MRLFDYADASAALAGFLMLMATLSHGNGPGVYREGEVARPFIRVPPRGGQVHQRCVGRRRLRRLPMGPYTILHHS